MPGRAPGGRRVEPLAQGDRNLRGAEGLQGGGGIAGPPPADARVAQKRAPARERPGKGRRDRPA